MNTYTTQGYYGSGHTACNVIVAETRDGGFWYCVEGSHNVNLTYEPVGLGVDVETLADADATTAGHPINTEDELVEHIES